MPESAALCEFLRPPDRRTAFRRAGACFEPNIQLESLGDAWISRKIFLLAAVFMSRRDYLWFF